MAAPEQLPAAPISDEEHGVGDRTLGTKEERPRVWWRRQSPRNRRRDLRTQPFPLNVSNDWRDSGQALATLYRHAESKALETMDWYLIDKRHKKLGSRTLRAFAIALVAAGGLQPLLSAARPGQGGAGWGYVLLALAAACVGFDRFFGLSSGWMRDMTSAQAVQRHLERFQFDWAALNARAALGLADPEQVLDRLDLLRAFSADLLMIVHRETTEWMVEFQSSLAELEVAGRNWNRPRSGHTDDGVASSGAFQRQGTNFQRAQDGPAAPPPSRG